MKPDWLALEVIIGDARETHSALLGLLDIPIDGHSALWDEDGKDIDCIKCAHINIAEYALAELRGSDYLNRLRESNEFS